MTSGRLATSPARNLPNSISGSAQSPKPLPLPQAALPQKRPQRFSFHRIMPSMRCRHLLLRRLSTRPALPAAKAMAALAIPAAVKAVKAVLPRLMALLVLAQLVVAPLAPAPLLQKGSRQPNGQPRGENLDPNANGESQTLAEKGKRPGSKRAFRRDAFRNSVSCLDRFIVYGLRYLRRFIAPSLDLVLQSENNLGEPAQFVPHIRPKFLAHGGHKSILGFSPG